jgi:hypothetical protein
MDIYVSSIGIPKTARNKRIYGGVSFRSTNTFESLGGGGAASKPIHVEKGTVGSLQSRDVEITFTEPFIQVPTGMSIVTVTRLTYNSARNAFIRENVLHYFPYGQNIVSTTGFKLKIDDDEPLLGIVIEYIFL